MTYPGDVDNLKNKHILGGFVSLLNKPERRGLTGNTLVDRWNR